MFVGLLLRWRQVHHDLWHFWPQIANKLFYILYKYWLSHDTIYQIVNKCVEVHLQQQSVWTNVTSLLYFLCRSSTESAGRVMPGGPSISSVFPELKPRRRVSCPGAVGAAGPELQMLRSGKHRGTCSTHRSLTPAHSPVLRMFRSKISTIRLRHLLAQSNTHGAFSGILPEGQRHNWPAHGVVKVLYTACYPGTNRDQRLFPRNGERWWPLQTAACYQSSLCNDYFWPLSGATAIYPYYTSSHWCCEAAQWSPTIMVFVLFLKLLSIKCCLLQMLTDVCYK